jgi:hypothetical protein
MFFFFSNDLKLKQRSAISVIYVAKIQKQLLLPYLPKMLELLATNISDAIVRCVFKVLSIVGIPPEIESDVIKYSFSYFVSTKMSPAIRIKAVQVAFDVAQIYPDLQGELKQTIELQLPNTKGAYKVKLHRLLNKF